MNRGFTLIELSIVLVIIGLIVGGVLVGQDLIRAAQVRAQITQIQKYNTAANTFYGKYGYFPGDISATAAAQFGFSARGSSCSGTPCQGEGDGNGVLQTYAQSTLIMGDDPGFGEPGFFWVDLGTANLIEGVFIGQWDWHAWMGVPANFAGSLSSYLPAAKSGGGNYLYVWSGGWANQRTFGAVNYNTGDNLNYFGISAITPLALSEGGSAFDSNPGLTVAQAYAIDAKMDDGFPQGGKVIAMYVNYNCGLNSLSNCWAAGGFRGNYNNLGAGWASNGAAQPPTTGATPWASTNCYDNNNTANTPQTYSMSQNASMVNCALSFAFQ